MTKETDIALFQSRLARRNTDALRYGAAIGATFVPAFWLLDLVVVPNRVFELLFLRVLMGLFSVAVLVLIWKKRSFMEQRHTFFTQALSLLITWSIELMVFLHEGYSSPYYAGICLVVMTAGFLFSWTTRNALIFSLLVYVPFLMPAVTDQIPITNAPLFFVQQFFLVSTIGIVFISQQFRYRLEERGFFGARALERTKASLEEALAKLKELDRAKGHFFSNITHELRTPLTMILAPLESIMAEDLGPCTEKQKSYLQSISKNGLKLLKLINDLLDFTKIEEHHLKLHLQKTDLVDFLQELVDFSKPLAQRAGIQLDLEIEAKPADLYVDLELMERAVINLVSNALKFTRKGGRVTLRLCETDAHALLEIADTGIGIPKDKLETIFERFSQADVSVTRRYGGTGIGLAFVREIVELHGGSVQVSSVPGQGSTFAIELKRGSEHFSKTTLERRQESASVDELRRGEDREPREWSRKLVSQQEYRLQDIVAATERRDPQTQARKTGQATILVVEDNPEVQRFVQMQLEDDYSVCVASNGQEGLDLALKETPDVIVTDYMMPEMDGAAMLRHLRQHTSTADVPAIMLTAKARLEDRVEVRQAGADIYLGKPFSPKELSAAIAQLLKKRGLQVAHMAKVQSKSLEIISAGLAHELHNPLTYIKNACFVIGETLEKIGTVLKNPEADPDKTQELFSASQNKISRMMNTAETGIRRIEQIVELVRRYAREGFSQEPVCLNVDAALKDVASLVSPKTDEEVHVDLDLQIGDGFVLCVAQDMQQVFRNLIQNAIDAATGSRNTTASDGARGQVTVLSRKQENQALIEVKDNGPGISKENIDRIFSPFFTTKTSGQSMGIGLAIANQIVMQCKGSIRVASEPEGGAVFTVQLPLVPSEESPVR